jgi:acetyl esterase
MAMAFARRGYLTFNVNYRLGPRHLFPAPLEDVAEALLWVRARCEEYGGDPARIALSGESAGGNLVTALACATSLQCPEPFARRVFEARVPVRAVVATYPFIDLSDVDRLLVHPRIPFWARDMLRDAVTFYVGHDVHGAVKNAPLSSPLLLLERATRLDRSMPAFFTNAGTRDPLLSHARRLKVALDRLSVPCELHVSPGEIHGFDAMVWRRAARVKWRRVYKFLEQHMDEGVHVETARAGSGAEH